MDILPPVLKYPPHWMLGELASASTISCRPRRTAITLPPRWRNALDNLYRRLLLIAPRAYCFNTALFQSFIRPFCCTCRTIICGLMSWLPDSGSTLPRGLGEEVWKPEGFLRLFHIGNKGVVLGFRSMLWNWWWQPLTDTCLTIESRDLLRNHWYIVKSCFVCIFCTIQFAKMISQRNTSYFK